MGKYRTIVVVAVVLVVALIGAGLLLNRGDDLVGDEIEPQVESEQPDSESEVVVTLEEFCDYQSTQCAALRPTLKKLKDEYGSALNVVFRNPPLPDVHKNALAAAQAAEAARMQSRFWEMHDLLYQTQDNWKDDPDPMPRFVQFARDLGLNVAQFSRDVDGEQVRMRLQADKDAAIGLGIQETPAILINGRRLKTDATTEQGIRKGIDLMMSQSDTVPPE